MTRNTMTAGLALGGGVLAVIAVVTAVLVVGLDVVLGKVLLALGAALLAFAVLRAVDWRRSAARPGRPAR